MNDRSNRQTTKKKNRRIRARSTNETMAASAGSIWIYNNDCLDVFSSSQHALSLSGRSRGRDFLLSLSLSPCPIQSITDDIIIVASGHHFKTYSRSFFSCVALTRAKDTSSSLSLPSDTVGHWTCNNVVREEGRIEHGSMPSRTTNSPFVFYHLSERVRRPWQGVYNDFFFSPSLGRR